MSRTDVRRACEVVIFAAAGTVAAVGLWFFCMAALLVLGFSFFSVTGAAFLEAAFVVALAVVMLLRNRISRSDVVKFRLLPLMAGMFGMTAYFVTVILVAGHP